MRQQSGLLIYIAFFFCLNCSAAGIDLTASGTVGEGTCSVALSQGGGSDIHLSPIDLTNTNLNTEYPVAPEDFSLDISDCSPGEASHSPVLEITGNTINGLWREPPDKYSIDNNVGDKYGFILLDDNPQRLNCDSEDANGVLLPGSCSLGNKGDMLADTNLNFTIGYGRNSGPLSVNDVGHMKSIIRFNFIYR